MTRTLKQQCLQDMPKPERQPPNTDQCISFEVNAYPWPMPVSQAPVDQNTPFWVRIKDVLL